MKGNQMLQQTVISRTSDIVRVENKYHNYYHSSFEHLTKRAIISASPAESEQTITKFRISTPFTYDLSVSKIIVSVRKKQNWLKCTVAALVIFSIEETTIFAYITNLGTNEKMGEDRGGQKKMGGDQKRWGEKMGKEEKMG